MALRDLVSKDRDIGLSEGRREDSFGRSLMSLRNDINRIFRDIWNDDDDFPRGFQGRHMAFPAVDVVENDRNFKVNAELFGMEPENVDVTVSGDMLVIQGERREERHDDGDRGNYLHREISYGSFRRVIPLPDAADADQAEASFRNGILTVDIPKKAEAARSGRKLTINRGDRESQGARH